MQFLYDYLFLAIWISWGLYWIVSARGVKPLVRRESTLSRWAHFGPLFLAGWLLSDGGRMWAPLRTPFMTRSETSFWIASAVTAVGLSFTIWARRHLGRNWSGSVTITADHELITTGPYRLARHPIYTGLLIAFAGNALVVGEVRGLIAFAFAIAFAALWRKLRLEERFMREQFGQAYEEYSRRVAAVVPFLL
jgi:protein-S-isoprenylcysteine O-methyltransferase Ste14